ncbi:hypothetical protein PCANC_08394 [Puccinia coronata f. sp. avenae]|nr:hypothetical protein PCANC_25717 [Puccinia coronata f. sp. avenae]PLW22465.1 hypothetical protein PCASD_11651 [Puccinia coronata f. sp. avenae]PLW45638.1 hypothetical protein PCANC_08394 [Puccinia coronata f. sp. avenae]
MLLDYVSAYCSGSVYGEFLELKQNWEENVVREMNRLLKEKETAVANRLEEIRLKKETAIAIQAEKATKKRVAQENKQRDAKRKMIKKTSDMATLQGLKDKATQHTLDVALALQVAGETTQAGPSN